MCFRSPNKGKGSSWRVPESPYPLSKHLSIEVISISPFVHSKKSLNIVKKHYFCWRGHFGAWVKVTWYHKTLYTSSNSRNRPSKQAKNENCQPSVWPQRVWLTSWHTAINEMSTSTNQILTTRRMHPSNVFLQVVLWNKCLGTLGIFTPE